MLFSLHLANRSDFTALRLHSQNDGLSHGLQNSPPDCFVPSLRSGRPFESLRRQKMQIPKWVSAFFGTPEGTRTPDLLIRSQSLYPTELPAHTTHSSMRPNIVAHHAIKCKCFFHFFRKNFLSSFLLPSFRSCFFLSIGL